MKRTSLVKPELLPETDMDVQIQPSAPLQENVEENIGLACPKKKKRTVKFNDAQDDNAIALETKPPPRKRPRTIKAKKCNEGSAKTKGSSKTSVVAATATAAKDEQLDDVLEFVVEMSSPPPPPPPPITSDDIEDDCPPPPKRRKAATTTTTVPKKQRAEKAAASPPQPEESLEVFITTDGYVCSKVRVKGKRLTRIHTIPIDVPFDVHLISIASPRYTIMSAFDMISEKWIASLHIHNEDTFIEAGTKLIKLCKY